MGDFIKSQISKEAVRDLLKPLSAKIKKGGSKQTSLAEEDFERSLIPLFDYFDSNVSLLVDWGGLKQSTDVSILAETVFYLCGDLVRQVEDPRHDPTMETCRRYSHLHLDSAALGQGDYGRSSLFPGDQCGLPVAQGGRWVCNFSGDCIMLIKPDDLSPRSY